MKATVENVEKFFRWLIKDIIELRVIFNYVFLSLFCFVVIWGVLHHPEICLNTAINSTSALAGWCMANFVWGGHMDKRLDMNIGLGNAPNTQVVNNVPGSRREPGLDG